MTVQLAKWIRNDAAASRDMLRRCRRRNFRRAPMWAAGIIAGSAVLGFLTEGGSSPALYSVYLPVGCAVALLYLGAAALRLTLLSQRAVRKAYTRGAVRCFRSEQEESIFCRQMEEGRFSTLEFQEKKFSFASKVLIGPDYWVYRGHFNSAFIKVADAEEVSVWSEHRSVGTERVVSGYSIAVRYRKELGRKGWDSVDLLSFPDPESLRKAIHRIHQFCPQIRIEGENSIA